MDAAELTRRKREVVERHGRWTAHNIHLGAGVNTMDTAEIGGSESRMRRTVQLTADFARRPFNELRVADLGALEGGFSVEFASRGAKVLAIEGRARSVAKAEFAKEVLGLDDLHIVEGDVRNFTRERHGAFDVVLAIGILYHLDFPDLFRFLVQVADACEGIAIIDTEIASRTEARDSFMRDGLTYKGCRYQELSGRPVDRHVLWSSVGNRWSFLPTRAAALNALAASGFTSALECHLPPVKDSRAERATFVAMRGSHQYLTSIPPSSTVPLGGVPEYELSLTASRYRKWLRRWLRRHLPAAIRRPLRRAMTRAGLRS